MAATPPQAAVTLQWGAPDGLAGRRAAGRQARPAGRRHGSATGLVCGLLLSASCVGAAYARAQPPHTQRVSRNVCTTAAQETSNPPIHHPSHRPAALCGVQQPGSRREVLRRVGVKGQPSMVGLPRRCCRSSRPGGGGRITAPRSGPFDVLRLPSWLPPLPLTGRRRAVPLVPAWARGCLVEDDRGPAAARQEEERARGWVDESVRSPPAAQEAFVHCVGVGRQRGGVKHARWGGWWCDTPRIGRHSAAAWPPHPWRPRIQ